MQTVEVYVFPNKKTMFNQSRYAFIFGTLGKTLCYKFGQKKKKKGAFVCLALFFRQKTSGILGFLPGAPGVRGQHSERKSGRVSYESAVTS